MGNHSLRNCQLPRNQANINKNRKEFSMRYMRLGVRYHLNEEQKFGHMIPGQLSQNLRAALGLRDNELPKHIYRYINIIHWILENYSFLLLKTIIIFIYIIELLEMICYILTPYLACDKLMEHYKLNITAQMFAQN